MHPQSGCGRVAPSQARDGLHRERQHADQHGSEDQVQDRRHPGPAQEGGPPRPHGVESAPRQDTDDCQSRADADDPVHRDGHGARETGRPDVAAVQHGHDEDEHHRDDDHLTHGVVEEQRRRRPIYRRDQGRRRATVDSMTDVSSSTAVSRSISPAAAAAPRASAAPRIPVRLAGGSAAPPRAPARIDVTCSA